MTDRDGDRISLLGFSRGAYTARTYVSFVPLVDFILKEPVASVAALVAFFGLLPAESNENDFKVLQDAYFAPSRNHYLYQGYCALKDYLFRPEHSSDVGPFNKDARKRFREDADTFCSRYKTRPVDIDFVGVWDTVNSVGLVTAAEAMFTSTNPKLRVLRHAIALDERRARFDRAMWRIKPKDEAKKDSLETKPVKPYPRKEQVWFAGAHCDVGGGAVLNDTRHSLACIPLRWMIRECFKTETGIIFDRQTLKDIGFDPTSLYPVVRPRPAPLPLHEDAVIQYAPSRWSWPFGSKEQQNSENAPVKTEEEHDHDDALAPVYDQLEVGYYSWNLLEIVPVKKWNSVTRKQTRDFNLRSGRVIDVHINKVDDQNNPLPEKEWKRLPPIKVHHTVKMRMHAKGGPGKGKYIPAAKLDFKGGMDLEADIDSDLVEWVY
ncbi:hypothetical protein VKT23_016984 [Stygiomarasmius scandens]|uniref:T6SS Phospholipase effector Tle1-like catalytic domain-containing protein n=1 Tax=Marasmiellus scandens TaxID=2682957 RepID=A0ABR1ITQ2_9AGAR